METIDNKFRELRKLVDNMQIGKWDEIWENIPVSDFAGALKMDESGLNCLKDEPWRLELKILIQLSRLIGCMPAHLFFLAAKAMLIAMGNEPRELKKAVYDEYRGRVSVGFRIRLVDFDKAVENIG
jgi:hypothetical protein